jgi:arylsulfatase A-like enzyme
MNPTTKSILIMCDSLRRDLRTPANAPTLARLASASCEFVNARGVFPSTTRTSSASIATGCLPARHGLLGNTVVLAEPDGLRSRSVGDPAFREHLLRATGRTLKVPTLAERVVQHGGALIMSNVSAGAAYFHDPDGHGSVYHRAGSYGPGRVAIEGEQGLHIKSGSVGDAAMTERFCAQLLAPQAPAAATLWLSEPDHSGHGYPLGSPGHLAGIAVADQCVAQVFEVVQTLRDRGENILFMVASDHGMETVLGQVPVNELLIEAGLKESRDSHDVVLAPNGSAFVLGVAPEASARIPQIVAFLREQPWVGSVHHGDALAELGLPVDDPCCAIAVAMKHSTTSNAFGVPGGIWTVDDPDDPKDYSGRGQHGGLGVFEQSPFLLVNGGGFAAGKRSAYPVSLIDFAPTLLRHLGLPTTGMDGRALPLAPDFI